MEKRHPSAQIELLFLVHGTVEETERLWRNMLDAKHDEGQQTEADCPPTWAGFLKQSIPRFKLIFTWTIWLIRKILTSIYWYAFSHGYTKGAALSTHQAPNAGRVSIWQEELFSGNPWCIQVHLVKLHLQLPIHDLLFGYICLLPSFTPVLSIILCQNHKKKYPVNFSRGRFLTSGTI